MDMKITGAYSQYISPPVKGQQFQVSHVPHARAGSDKVSLSSQAEDYRTAIRAMQITPDIRHELVDNLRNMITNGTYNICPHDVAARIFHGLED